MTSLVTPHSCPIYERSSFSRWSMRLWKECLDLSVKDENLETAPHVLGFFDLSPKVSSLNTVNQRSWKHRVALLTIRKNFLKQLLMFWKIQAYFKELMFEHRLARGCERSVQLRANKRGFFKIAPHILENHRLLLRSCFLNAVYSFLEIIEETETSFF